MGEEAASEKIAQDSKEFFGVCNLEAEGELFKPAVTKNLCAPVTFEDGLTCLAEVIDDIVIDAPKAFDLFAIMIKGAGLDKKRKLRLVSKSMDSDTPLTKLSL